MKTRLGGIALVATGVGVFYLARAGAFGEWGRWVAAVISIAGLVGLAAEWAIGLRDGVRGFRDGYRG